MEKINTRYAKIILFSSKKAKARKRIFFLFYQIVTEKFFFIKEFKWKVFTNNNFVDFAMKTVNFALKSVLNKKQSGWSTTLQSA